VGGFDHMEWNKRSRMGEKREGGTRKVCRGEGGRGWGRN
jgi:hypothetical protein